jgi:hypothetical protein
MTAGYIRPQATENFARARFLNLSVLASGVKLDLCCANWYCTLLNRPDDLDGGVLHK